MQRVKNIINKINNEAGFTLVEILVALFILAIIITALASSFVLATRITAENRLEMMAVSLANEAVEEIRSLEFSEIGTLGGDPAGDIPQYRVENINGVEFGIYTMINWEEQEDGFIDGNLSWDYKSIRVTVAPRNLGALQKPLKPWQLGSPPSRPLPGGISRLTLYAAGIRRTRRKIFLSQMSRFPWEAGLYHPELFILLPGELPVLLICRMAITRSLQTLPPWG